LTVVVIARNKKRRPLNVAALLCYLIRLPWLGKISAGGVKTAEPELARIFESIDCSRANFSSKRTVKPWRSAPRATPPV
jgi:hypothetical protein